MFQVAFQVVGFTHSMRVISPTILEGVPVATGARYTPDSPADVTAMDPPPSLLRDVLAPNVRDVVPDIKSRHTVGDEVAKLDEIAPSREKVGVDIVAAFPVLTVAGEEMTNTMASDETARA